MFLKIKLFLVLLIFASCNTENPTENKIAKAGLDAMEVIKELPQLLDRGTLIQNGNEWERVQNQYGKFRQQIIRNQKPLEAKLNLARLFSQEARVTGEHGYYYPAALKLLNDILKPDLEDKDLKFSVLSAKASVLLSQHEFAKALEIGQEALKMNPYNAQIYGVLVDANVELGHYKKAVEKADKMVSIRPDLRSYSRVSYLREIYGRTEGSMEVMKMAVKAGYPGYEETAWTRLQLGNLYQRYGQMENAKMQYFKILMERPNYPFAMAALAKMEVQNKNYEKAEKLLKEACALIPEVSFYKQLAQLYFETGRKEEGEKMIPQILSMLKKDIESGHNVNLLYAAVYADLKKDYDKAIEYALAEYDRRPENIDVNKMLATLYRQKGETVLAKKYLKKAMITNSKNPALLELRKVLG